MNTDIKTIRPFGNTGILIEWDNQIDTNILSDILAFQKILNDEIFTNTAVNYIPAYNSLTLVFNQPIIDFSKYQEQIQLAYQNAQESTFTYNQRVWKLPVCYDTSFGIDLKVYANGINLSIDEIIDIHTNSLYTIYAIGFLPGFMYLGGLDKRLIHPRKSVPNLRILPGSVGIAGMQTGIYPQASPGGWNIIGNCPVPLFDPSKQNPCFFSVGDQIHFYAISLDQHQKIQTDYQNGNFPIEKLEADA